MALSEQEQQLLDEMERRLYQSEADVVKTPSGPRRALDYRALVLGILVALVGVGVLIGGVAAQQLWLGMIGFAVMLGGVLLLFTRGKETEQGASEGSASKQGGQRTAESGESLSDRFERRWNQRMDGGL